MYDRWHDAHLSFRWHHWSITGSHCFCVRADVYSFIRKCNCLSALIHGSLGIQTHTNLWSTPDAEPCFQFHHLMFIFNKYKNHCRACGKHNMKMQWSGLGYTVPITVMAALFILYVCSFFCPIKSAARLKSKPEDVNATVQTVKSELKPNHHMWNIKFSWNSSFISPILVAHMKHRILNSWPHFSNFLSTLNFHLCAKHNDHLFG